MTDPLFYAKGDRIYQRPVERVRADGSTGVSIGFAVCTLQDGVEPAELAKVMNAGDSLEAVVAAAKKMLEHISAAWPAHKERLLVARRAAIAGALHSDLTVASEINRLTTDMQVLLPQSLVRDLAIAIAAAEPYVD